ncbi:hypothetical protein FBU30_003767 [Linnemannia zychae]|nr:hypothetical protein FBU30_003767 [Linnemannia zychae]
MESVLEQPTVPSVKILDQTSLHLLPCGIQHDGKANISTYFFLVDGQYPTATANSATATTATTNTTTAITAESSTTSTFTTCTTENTADENVLATTTLSSETTTTTALAANLSTESKPVPPEISFRGRTLKGTIMSVPEGYIGTVYKPSELSPDTNHRNSRANTSVDMDLDEDQEYEAMLKGMQEERKTMRTEAHFKEWTSWGHDDEPTTRTDKVIRAMQWIDIASVLHDPLC